MAASTPRYFVKFVPYNQLTLSSLINQEIYFSRVYEFNDFTELNIIGDVIDNIQPFIKQYINDINFKFDFLKHYAKQGDKKTYTEQFITNLKEQSTDEFVNGLTNTQQLILMEWIAYYSVGIFSLSELNVFEDDAAMLMFAHYAQNLTGIACIYEITSECELTLEKIKQPTDSASESDPEQFKVTRTHTTNFHERIIDWTKNDYRSVDNFKRKSKSWGYEKEWRLFAAPGLKKTADIGVRLRTILYTPRFNPGSVETLQKINELFYEGKLSIAELHPSGTGHHFNVTPTGSEDTPPLKSIDWLRDALNIANNGNGSENSWISILK